MVLTQEIQRDFWGVLSWKKFQKNGSNAKKDVQEAKWVLPACSPDHLRQKIFRWPSATCHTPYPPLLGVWPSHGYVPYPRGGMVPKNSIFGDFQNFLRLLLEWNRWCIDMFWDVLRCLECVWAVENRFWSHCLAGKLLQKGERSWFLGSLPRV